MNVFAKGIIVLCILIWCQNTYPAIKSTDFIVFCVFFSVSPNRNVFHRFQVNTVGIRTRALSPGVATPATTKEARSSCARERASSVVRSCVVQGKQTVRCVPSSPFPDYEDDDDPPTPLRRDNQYGVWGKKSGKGGGRDVDLLQSKQGRAANWHIAR